MKFSYAGFARNPQGELKFWVGQDGKRAEAYSRAGWSDVSGFALAHPMTKTEAREYAGDFSVKSGYVTKSKKNTVVVSVPPTALVQLVGAQVKVISGEAPLTAAEARRIRDAWNKKHAHLSYTGE